MIYLEVHGRLGNQLFQYAFARKLQIERQDKLTINFHKEDTGENASTYGNQLQFFNIPKEVQFSYDDTKIIFRNTTFIQKLIYFLYKITKPDGTKHHALFKKYQEIVTPLLNKAGLFLQAIAYTRECPCKRRDIIISGYFECSRYFDGIKDILRKEYTPASPPLDKNQELYETIINRESVFVGVRRGDRLRSRKIMDERYICREEYYNEAIKKMRELHPDAVFIIFSNDIDWCKTAFQYIGSPCFFESGDDPVWETLRLMSCCKHFIIANSTLHWWAQFLSSNQSKTVIAPAKWLNIAGYDSDQLEDSFIKIKTKN